MWQPSPDNYVSPTAAREHLIRVRDRWLSGAMSRMDLDFELTMLASVLEAEEVFAVIVPKERDFMLRHMGRISSPEEVILMDGEEDEWMRPLYFAGSVRLDEYKRNRWKPSEP
jgi:hypothetical protein